MRRLSPGKLPQKSVLITDLDNTIFDWVDLWCGCFSVMLTEISRISGISVDLLKPEIRRVHTQHGTSEYSFLIEELPSLRQRFPSQDLLKVFAPAIEKYQAERRKHLALYPTVAETLLKIKGSGAMIVAYTESMAFYSNYRLRRLGLDGVIDTVFSPQDHDLPKSIKTSNLRKYPASQYELKYTRHNHTPKQSKKPDAKVLAAIIKQLGLKKVDCVYVGDSLFKDIAMAQDAGVADAWAKYGETQQNPNYNLLREVTHWTDRDVERERKIKQRHVKPTITLKSSFSEILDCFSFGNRYAR